MRPLLGLLLLAACPLFSADSDFNGRWDISATNQTRTRAWWLELTGVGAATPAGKFVSAYGGDMNTIDTISVEKGELRFVINPPPSTTSKLTKHSLYRPRLVNGKMECTFRIEG